MNEPRAQRSVAPTNPASAGTTAPGFAPSAPFIALAYSVLAREAATLAENASAGESTPTPEEIHRLRVAARRLRVALRVFRRMLPSEDVVHFRAGLREFARALGDARDLDVYAESFKTYAQALPPEERADLSGYELYLRRERTEARQRAAAALASERTGALLADLARFVAAGPSAGALRRWRSLTVRDAVRRGIRRSVRRVRRLGDVLDGRARPTALHELRIKTKRLRYELEFFADAYPQLAPIAKACKTQQDLLGAHQDVYAANARLRRYAALRRKQGADDALPPALAELRKRQFAVARGVRQSFQEQWPGFAATIGAARRAVD